MPLKNKRLSVPESMRARYAEITSFTDALCHEKLNEEYSLDGYVLDARHLPRSLQEEAYCKGLIPYLPSEQDGE